MKFLLIIFIIGLFSAILTDGRLIQKNKTRNVEETQTEKPNPSIRLTRDIENDSLTGFSKEEPVQSQEFIRSYRKKARFFFKSKPKASKMQIQKKTRIIRDSMENIKPEPKSEDVKEFKMPTKPKAVLVKKPIPKFYYKDYDDIQSKVSNSHIIIDTSDHEDEDFNLEDYDFDTNHDEFTSGRKPLEPRIMRIKKTEFETKKPTTKIISKVVLPDSSTKAVSISNKKGRAAEQYSEKPTDNMKELDYYDDITTTKATETVTKTQDDEDSDENENSKEFERMNSTSTRTARSWNVNLFGEQYNNPVSRIVTKFLSVLPLFPEVPNSYQIEPANLDSNEVMADPLTGRNWILDF